MKLRRKEKVRPTRKLLVEMYPNPLDTLGVNDERTWVGQPVTGHFGTKTHRQQHISPLLSKRWSNTSSIIPKCCRTFRRKMTTKTAAGRWGCLTWNTQIDNFQVFSGVGTRICATECCIVHIQRTIGLTFTSVDTHSITSSTTAFYLWHNILHPAPCTGRKAFCQHKRVHCYAEIMITSSINNWQSPRRTLIVISAPEKNANTMSTNSDASL